MRKIVYRPDLSLRGSVPLKSSTEPGEPAVTTKESLSQPRPVIGSDRDDST